MSPMVAGSGVGAFTVSATLSNPVVSDVAAPVPPPRVSKNRTELNLEGQRLSLIAGLKSDVRSQVWLVHASWPLPPGLRTLYWFAMNVEP